MKISEFVGVLVILLICFILFSLVLYLTTKVCSVLHNPEFTSLVLITVVLLFLSLMLCIVVLVLYYLSHKTN